MERIDRLARCHGKEIEIDLPAPASPDALALLETYMGKPPAKSHGDFLRQHNGLSIRVGDIYKLEVYSVARVIRQTEDLRDYLDLLGDGSAPYGRKNVRRFFDIADIFQSIDDRIVCDVESITANEECRILSVWMDDAHTWLWAPPDKRDEYCVSDSFAGFIERALEHMIEVERGFAYWNRNLDLDLWDQ